MRVPFRRSKVEPQIQVDPEEVRALLPASVRHPEANRFTPLGSDFAGEEGTDEDLDFLTALVESVDREEAGPGLPAARPAPPPAHKPSIQRMAPRAEAMVLAEPDHLSLFRETKVDLRERTRANVTVDDVDLGDLLEDLETTRAALRRRKAA
ncbi:MAG TPA: hypothetical protein VEZ14_11045 [Dehalococcoidia bacterium]|nr:hypothetical protein [Dehalococcoidia bacterium]